MDFSWTDEQITLRRGVIDFATNELNDDLVERDADGDFSVDAWKKCAAFGIQGLPFPAVYGGGDADPLTTLVALEALGYGCRDNGLIFSLNAQMWSCQTPIARFGSEEQKARYLPRLCDGSLIGVQAMTEPNAGSDALGGMTTTATAVDGSYVLRGAKTFITNAPVAGVFVVFAATEPSRGFAGVSTFLVDRDTPGLVIGRPFRKMGLRTSPMSELHLDDCVVPGEALLGPIGAGMSIFNHSMDWERSYILASAIGTMERQLERSVSYARNRTQFGRPIGKNQAVSHRLVDMKLRLEGARVLLYRLAWMRSRGKTSPMESALVKLVISEAFLSSSLDALQTHGGYGYMTEEEIERQVRDAVAGRIYSGTSDIQRNIIAGFMGL